MSDVPFETRLASLLTLVEVDAADPAFQKPSKPVGPFFAKDRAERLQREAGWTMVEDAGRGWRRVVSSPKPKRVVEIEVVRHLVGEGLIRSSVDGPFFSQCAKSNASSVTLYPARRSRLATYSTEAS